MQLQMIKRVSLITLAIAEMIALSIAIGSVGYFLDGISKSVDGSVQYNLLVDQGIYGRHEFFLSAVVIGLFSAIISFFIVIANRQGNPKLAAQMITLRTFCAMLILVSASLLTKTVRTYAKEKSGVCKGLKAGTSDARCAQLTVGVVFGFFSLALFVVDTFIYVSNLLQRPDINFVNMNNPAS